MFLEKIDDTEEYIFSFGEKMPQAIKDQFYALKDRLKKALSWKKQQYKHKTFPHLDQCIIFNTVEMGDFLILQTKS